MRFAQIAPHPFHQFRQPRGLAQRDRAADALAAFGIAPRRQHQSFGDQVGYARAVILAHHVQHHVHAGGRPGRGDDAAGVHIQHVVAYVDAWEFAGQRFGEPPVGGGLAAVEQAGPGEHERAGADGGDAGAARMGAGEGIEQRLRGALAGFAPAGNDDDVGVVDRTQIVGQLHLCTAEHAQRTGLASAELGAVPGHAQFGADGREQTDRAAEFEQALAVAGHDGDGGRVRFGRQGGHGLMLPTQARAAEWRAGMR
ncbi:hypothetical protein D3C73_750030 [compost metagenome]